MTKLSMSVGKNPCRPSEQFRRIANDNLSREQELFEKCVQRELGGLANPDGKQTTDQS